MSESVAVISVSGYPRLIRLSLKCEILVLNFFSEEFVRRSLSASPLMKPCFFLPLKGGNLRFVCESFAFVNVYIMSRHGLKAMLQSPFGHLPLWRLLGLLEVRLQ